MTKLVGFSRAVIESGAFNIFITSAILFGAVLVGLETYPVIMTRYEDAFHLLNAVILWIFVVEIALRFLATWPQPGRYVRDGWNIFDVVIVGAAFLPGVTEYALALRLLRLLRVLRLLRTVPDLQLIINALLRALPSMGYVIGFLGLLFYVYGVAGTFLFRANDPVHFGSLEISLVSLFRVMTLEDWTDVMYTQMYGCDLYGYGAFEELCTAPHAMPVVSVAYFVSFVLLGTMIFLNLFIGIIVNSMDEMRKQRDAADDVNHDLEGDLAALEDRLAELTMEIGRVRERARRERSALERTRP